MEKKQLFSTYIDAKKGGVPITMEMTGDPKKGSIVVKIKPRHGKLELKKADLSVIEEIGKGYVQNAREEIMLQTLHMGMTTFAERFPLVSIALQNPSLYLSKMLSLLADGLKRRNLQTFMALIDAAYKAKDGVLPDPLPAKLKNKIKIAQYKKWGNDVTGKLKKVATEFGKGLLLNDFFSEMDTMDLDSIIKLTQQAADFYQKQAK